jgi:tetratricopeptide (TPR) repeat protein
MLEQALALHAQGRLAEAEQAYRAILAREPDNAGVGNQLGILALDAGMPEHAAPIFERACTLAPDDGGFHANRGLSYMRLNRPEEALAAFDRAIALDPTLVQPHLHRGMVLKELKRQDEALESFARALALREEGATHNFIGLTLDELGRWEEALESFARAVALDGDLPQVHSNYGHALVRLRRFEEALPHFEKAVAMAPKEAGFHYNHGEPLKALGRLPEALAAYDRALELEPNLVGAHINRGLVLIYLGRPDEAMAAFERAIAMEPDSVMAHMGYTDALVFSKRIEESLAYDRELMRNPALKADAQFHSGFLLLQRGEWQEAWKFYEARRTKKEDPVITRSFPQPEWRGDVDIQGKTLFVHAEQGLGDTIQFSRYLPLAAARGARVFFSPQKRLERLMRSLGRDVEILPADGEPEQFDLHMPLMSMPMAFGTLTDSIPATVPYLAPEAALVEKWRARIGDKGFKVGICWNGSNNNILMGTDRSFPLRQAAGLAGLAGVRLISLQAVDGLEQLDDLPPGMTVETLGDDFDTGPDAFVDSAAAMASLDLIISCDTSVAHLAGALARPVWTVLKSNPEWRFSLKPDTMPWYPTMRLFRQGESGGWAPVFATMQERLAKMLETA